MQKDNNECGVGVAYGAKIAGMLSILCIVILMNFTCNKSESEYIIHLFNINDSPVHWIQCQNFLIRPKAAIKYLYWL